MEVYQHTGFINLMTKTLIVFEQGPAIDEPEYQELWDPENRTCLFTVSNLWECPEDAIIGRALCDADDAKDLMLYGIKYANAGYDSIKLIYEYCPNDEDLDKFIENYLDNWKTI